MLNDIIKSLGDVRVTQLGCIKIGGKGESRPTSGGGTFRLPRKDDHFTITTMNRTASGDLVIDKPLMDQLLEEHADDDGKLRQIPIRVLSDDIDDILQAQYAWYGRKSCGARSDGKTVTWYCCPNPGPKYGTLYKPPIVEPWLEEPMLAMKGTDGKPLFKLHGTFNCVIAAKESRFGGVYRFRTTSLISVKQLYSSLLHVSQLTGGVLIGMPLTLVVRPQQVSPEGKATTVYTVHVELRGRGIMELQQQAVQQMQFMLENKQRMLTAQTEYRKLLCALESKEEQAAIADEFHPDAQELAPAPDDYLDIEANEGGVTNDPASDGGESTDNPAPLSSTKAGTTPRAETGQRPEETGHASETNSANADPIKDAGPLKMPASTSDGRNEDTAASSVTPPTSTNPGAAPAAAPVVEGEPSAKEQDAIAFSEMPLEYIRRSMQTWNPLVMEEAKKRAGCKGAFSKAPEAIQRQVAYFAKLAMK
jgi:hypothetical protein